MVNDLKCGSGSLVVIPLTPRHMMLERGAHSNWAKTLRDRHMGKIRASEACFLLRTLNPVERLARDGVLSEKEAQLSRMFLHVAQGVH
jgi:hypothetical protein